MGGRKRPDCIENQYWNLYSIDRKQRFRLQNLRRFLFSQWSDLVYHLAAPVMPPYYFEKNEWAKGSDSSNAAVSLLQLPVEVLQIIANEMIDNYLDVICLSLTCTAMWEVTERARYLSLLATLQNQNWAGTRIICLGNFSPDLPKGLFTLEDREQCEEVIKEHGRNSGDEYDDDEEVLALLKQASVTLRRPKQLSLFSIDSTHGQDVLDEIYGEIKTSLKGKKGARRWVQIRNHDFRLVLQSAEDRWMLRNLSKREFVLKSKGSDPSSLGQALLSLICWSTDPSISMDCDDSVAETLVNGPWAGDRIDVTLVSIHDQQECNNGDWKDITPRVAEFWKTLASTERRAKGFQFDV